MNFCKQCGKEITEGKKFCNSSCAAKYNNKHRTRKPWTEEQKRSVRTRVLQRCKYCGKLTGKCVSSSAALGTCSDCKPYTQRVISYRKLGIYTGSLVERDSQFVQEICKSYFDRKESICSLHEKYDIDVTTLYRTLKQDSNLRSVRSIGESQQIALEQHRKDIPGNIRFQQGIHTTWEGFKFHYRSSWELKYMEYLDSKKISYRVEPFYIRYWDSQKGKERLAKPDFYLPDSNVLIELKSNYTYCAQNMKDKFKAYRKQGYTPRLLLDWKFIDL